MAQNKFTEYVANITNLTPNPASAAIVRVTMKECLL
jgi:hypothetical protein